MKKGTVMNRVKSFLNRKGVELSARKYFVDAMSSMAVGLFSTLLIGTIFSTLAKYVHWELLSEISSYVTAGSFATGAVLAVAIASCLKAPPLVLCSAGVVGAMSNALGATFTIGGAEKTLTAGPAGVFFCALVAVELGKIVSKETKVDILVTPCVTILSGALLAKLLCPIIAYVMYWLGYFINTATEYQPIIMGIVISVVVGIILTLPISSAAICAIIGISGLAGGAAVAGCCAQMVGFAVISFRENRWGGIVAQGLGTSMLQMGNIVKKPIIWIPATLASAITGPLATAVFGLRCNGVSAGMGTCGLVGPLGVIEATDMNALTVTGIILICLVLPAILSLAFSEFMRYKGWIKLGDLQLDEFSDLHLPKKNAEEAKA